MRCWVVIGSLVAAFGATGAAADCAVSSDTGAVSKPVDASTKEGAALVVSMSMLPKLMHIDYTSAARKRGCDLGSFSAGTKTYELYGDDEAGRHREAIPAKKGGPVAAMVPITDIMKAIEASENGQTVQIEGYLLATITRHDFTGWRFYTGMPDQDVLRHDMAEALGGTGAPIFRNSADGKTELFMPKD